MSTENTRPRSVEDVMRERRDRRDGYSTHNSAARRRLAHMANQGDQRARELLADYRVEQEAAARATDLAERKRPTSVRAAINERRAERDGTAAEARRAHRRRLERLAREGNEEAKDLLDQIDNTNDSEKDKD